MTDLTEILAKPPALRGCPFADWKARLEPEEREAVDKALLNPEWSAAKLTAVFKQFGMTSGREGVMTHRNGDCRTCGPI